MFCKVVVRAEGAKVVVNALGRMWFVSPPSRLARLFGVTFESKVARALRTAERFLAHLEHQEERARVAETCQTSEATDVEQGSLKGRSNGHAVLVGADDPICWSCQRFTPCPVCVFARGTCSAPDNEDFGERRVRLRWPGQTCPEWTRKRVNVD